MTSLVVVAFFLLGIPEGECSRVRMALHPTYGKAVVALPQYSAVHETVNSFLLTFIFNQNSSPLPSLTSLPSVPTAREVRAVAAAVLQGPGRADVAAPERR